ncbi:hypothetical protein ACFL4Y_04135 [Gemmatimonadota bacterium]
MLLLYLGSVIIILWGIGHLAPTSGIVKGFGDLTSDNRRIITMEWIAEGLTLIFLGVLPLLVTALAGPDAGAADIVYRSVAGMLIVLAVLSLTSGARTSVLPMKLCPAVKTVAAALILIGSL